MQPSDSIMDTLTPPCDNPIHEHAVMHAPEGLEGEVSSVRTAICTEDASGVRFVHVPYKPDEIELARLAQGGTLWLTVMGGLPPHHLTVT